MDPTIATDGAAGAAPPAASPAQAKPSRKMAVLDGIRKLLFGLAGLLFLGWGLWFMRPALPPLPAGAVLDPVSVSALASASVGLYDKFSWAVWLIVAAVVLGNVGEHVAAVFGRRGEGGAP